MRIEPRDICFGNLLAYFKFVRKYACCINPLPDLAYANVFAQKLQPFAYSGYVPGRLPAKDGYAQRSPCLTFGQNMIILHI